MKGKVLIVYGGKRVEDDILVIKAMQNMKFFSKKDEFFSGCIDRVGKGGSGENFSDIKKYLNFFSK